MDSLPESAPNYPIFITLFATILYALAFLLWYVYRYLTLTRHDVAVTSLNDLAPADHIFLRLPFTWNRPTELTRHALYLGKISLEGQSEKVRAIADFGVLNSKHPVIRPLEDFLQSAQPTNASPDPAPSDPLRSDRLTVPLFKRTFYTNQDAKLTLQPRTVHAIAERFVVTRKYRPYNALLNNGEMYIDLLKTGPFEKPVSEELNNWIAGCLAVLTTVLLLVAWILVLGKLATLKILLPLLLAPITILLIFICIASRSSRLLQRRLFLLILDIFDVYAECADAAGAPTTGLMPTVTIAAEDREKLVDAVGSTKRKPVRRPVGGRVQETSS